MSKLQTEMKTVHILINGTFSAGFEMPNWATFALAFFPNMDVGAVGLEVSPNGGTNYYPVLKPDGSADAAVVGSGLDPAWSDISDYVRALPDEASEDVLMRFTCAAQASAALDVLVYFKE
jgi:hypothetical protein